MKSIVTAIACVILLAGCSVGTSGLHFAKRVTWDDFLSPVDIDLDVARYDKRGDCESFQTFGLDVGIIGPAQADPCDRPGVVTEEAIYSLDANGKDNLRYAK